MKKSVEISVGTIFSVKGEEPRTDVVTNTGQRNWFFASRCNIENNEFTIIGGNGTAGPENVLEIAGRFPKKMVREKMIQYWEERIGHPLNNEFLKVIYQDISGKLRRIDLD